MARILFVDDNAKVLADMGLLMRDRGHQVTCTNNGMDAIARLSLDHYDAIVLDIRMPGLDGNGVLNRLSPDSPPVIVFTGNDDDLKDFVGTKVKRLVKKPADPAELFEAIDSVLAPPAAPARIPVMSDPDH